MKNASSIGTLCALWCHIARCYLSICIAAKKTNHCIVNCMKAWQYNKSESIHDNAIDKYVNTA